MLNLYFEYILIVSVQLFAILEKNFLLFWPFIRFSSFLLLTLGLSQTSELAIIFLLIITTESLQSGQ
jgi:hypothetical protein